MTKFCRKCGTPLDERTGKCPKCGTGKRCFFLIGTTAILALAVVIFVFIRFHTPEPVTMESGSPISESSTEPSTKPPEPTVAKKPEPRTRTQTPPPTVTEPAALESFLPSEIPDYAAAYLQVIQEREEKMWPDDISSATGELFDLNSDGIPEMALCYTATDIGDGDKSPGYIVCDLYTYINEEAVPLLEEESVTHRVYFGRFSFAEIGGNKFFLLESCKNLGDVDWYANRYRMDGFRLIQDRSDHWGCTEKLIHTVNGVTMSDTAFEAWSNEMISSFLPNTDGLALSTGVSLDQIKKELRQYGGGVITLDTPIPGKKPVTSIANKGAEKLIDGDLSTNWASEQAYFGKEHLSFELEENTLLYGVCIWAGNHCDASKYKEDNRQTLFSFSAGEGIEGRYWLRDTMAGQVVFFAEPISTNCIKMAFGNTTFGKKENFEVVVSEIDFLTSDKLEALASRNAFPFSKEKSSFVAAYTNILQELQHNYGDYLTGQLEDINHDDIPELAVCYPLQEKGVRYLAYNLYTYSDNHVQTLAESEKLNTLADGHFGGIQFATINGTACFATYMECIVNRSYRPAGTSFSSGQWKTYILDSSQMQCDTDIEFEMYSTLTPEIRLALNDDFAAMMKGEGMSTFYTISEADFSATLNGEEMSYHSYLSWDRISRTGWRNTTYGSSTQKLIDKLQTF